MTTRTSVLPVQALRALGLASLLALAPCSFAAAPILRYTDTCDASAGVSLSADLFLIASDEDNVLRTYRRGTGGRPVTTQRLDTFLSINEESDLEGVARAGDRLYWISSHGRNKKGKPRPARQQFFATDVAVSGAQVTLTPVGSTYRDLLKHLISHPKLASLKLAQAEPLAPEAPGGLNIEALAVRPEGGLWIGFRNPVPAAGAILVPLLNPDAVIESGAAPEFDVPVHLDLGGRGLRSMETVPGGFIISAGPSADSGTFQLFAWTGRASDQPRAVAAPLADLRPEALFTLPDGKLMVISDDGGVEIGGQECKDLPDASARGFRALELDLPR